LKNINPAPVLVFVLSLLLLLVNLGEPEIYILDEAKNAECAREMYVSGNYIVPYFNGQLRTDKPPLHYFFMSLAYQIFGVSSFSARFFSAVFGALTVLITYLFAQRYLGKETALLAALVLISSLHFNLQMRLAVPDPYLIFFITAGVFCFYNFIEQKQKKWLWLMYACFGLGILTKGPVALGIPGLAILIFLLITKRLNWRLIREFQVWAGVLIMLLIACPWFILNYKATNGEWTSGFFLKHNLERFTNTMEGHGGFFLLPLLMVILGLIPLGVFIIRAFINVIKNREEEPVLICALLVTVIVIFFSFSKTKLPNYTAPAYPFAAVLIAYLLSKAHHRIKSFKPELIAYTVIAFAIPLAVYVAFRNNVDYADFSKLALFFIPLPIGAIAAWIMMRSEKAFIYPIIASFIICNLLFFTAVYPKVYLNNPVHDSAKGLINKKLVYYKKLNPAYVFKIKKVIRGFENPESLKEYIKLNPDALVISRIEFAQEIESTLEVDTIFKKRDTFERPVTAVFKLKRHD